MITNKKNRKKGKKGGMTYRWNRKEKSRKNNGVDKIMEDESYVDSLEHQISMLDEENADLEKEIIKLKKENEKLQKELNIYKFLKTETDEQLNDYQIRELETIQLLQRLLTDLTRRKIEYTEYQYGNYNLLYKTPPETLKKLHEKIKP